MEEVEEAEVPVEEEEVPVEEEEAGVGFFLEGVEQRLDEGRGLC